MDYLVMVQFEFWLGRDHFYTRNLDTIFQDCSEMSVGRGLYRLKACLISCLASIWYDFLLRGVSEYILVFVISLFFLLVIFQGHAWEVQFWQSCMLMACSFINSEIFCKFMGLLSVGECISSKGNCQSLLLLKMNFTLDVRLALSITR